MCSHVSKLSSDRPCRVSPKTIGKSNDFHSSTSSHPSIASLRLAINSSQVSPSVIQPGRAGTSAQFPSSSAW
jgi:hypothetical protein